MKRIIISCLFIIGCSTTGPARRVGDQFFVQCRDDITACLTLAQKVCNSNSFDIVNVDVDTLGRKDKDASVMFSMTFNCGETKFQYSPGIAPRCHKDGKQVVCP